MNQEQVIEKLREVIKPYVQDEEAFQHIKPETDLLKDLKINSAHLVDIILDTEDAFDIEINDEDAEQMLTVKDAVGIIMKRMAR